MKNIYVIFLLAAIGAVAAFDFTFADGGEWLKLPYAAGEQFVVVQGYNSPPTHINKDYYAIDFSQDGCEAYGKPAVAAFSGKVSLVQENGYNGGYGTQVLVESDASVVGRYAHLVAGTIGVSEGQIVLRGQALGKIGDTGLVMGTACRTHPGTHLHFAMYDEHPDGTFTAHLPEPISNYTNITQGKWYLSDNFLDGDAAEALPQVLGASTTTMPVAPPLQNSSSLAQSTSPAIVSASVAPTIGGGGVSVAPLAPEQTPPQSIEPEPNPQTVAATSTLQDTSSSDPLPLVPSSTIPETPTSTPSSPQSLALATATFNSSTLAVDISWQPTQLQSSSASSVIYEVFKSASANTTDTFGATLVGTTTNTSFSYALSDEDFLSGQFFFIEFGEGTSSTGSTVALASTTIPHWFNLIQPIDGETSRGSWYSDNWYQLGSGFSGILKSLTLKGFIDDQAYRASHIYLDEFLDNSYANLSQTFTLSDNAPFTDTPETITIGGLNIVLQADRYYRLRTYQDYQNRSVILEGTTATGTAMDDGFLYGTGRTEEYYSFYPYLGIVMVPGVPVIATTSSP